MQTVSSSRLGSPAVSCETDDRGLHALAEPTLVVEILSPRNEAKTRESVLAYATIPTVREILLIRSTRTGAELLRREDEAVWPPAPEQLGAGATLRLESIDFSCPLPTIYEGTHLSPAGGT